MRSLRGASAESPKEAYFFDLQTRELFSAPLNARPPVAAPSDSGGPGRSGVRASILSCESCDHKDSRYTGYLERAGGARRGAEPPRTDGWTAVGALQLRCRVGF